ncbi:hypothetical protein [Cognatishimia activa]|uniref:Uncharacterized protein n=1 Tax=Cognatishimia activa TaxID=1715691 RepID=A0A975EQL2_9RHOB|nr:hypothetical protein [Cognatishimia activa]QTN36390.1 hypothetical protein HZ995_02410 [Cognatishimia activa]
MSSFLEFSNSLNLVIFASVLTKKILYIQIKEAPLTSTWRKILPEFKKHDLDVAWERIEARRGKASFNFRDITSIFAKYYEDRRYCANRARELGEKIAECVSDPENDLFPIEFVGFTEDNTPIKNGSHAIIYKFKD